MKPSTLLVLLLALLLAACGEEQKAKVEDAGRTIGEKAGAAWNKVRTFTAEQKDEALRLWDENKDGLRARYEKAKAKGGELGADAKDALAERWKDVEAAYGVARDAGAEGWEAAQKALVSAYEAFHAELKKHE